jgi:hypothetical protein
LANQRYGKGKRRLGRWVGFESSGRGQMNGVLSLKMEAVLCFEKFGTNLNQRA